MKKVITEVGAFYQHYPRVAIVVSASYGDKDNAMTIAWHMPVSKDPPMVAFVSSTEHYTYRLITESKEFGINLLPDTKSALVAAIGGSKGVDLDKFKAFNIKKDKPIKTSVPIFQDAYAALECKLVEERLYHDHSMFIGEVVAVHFKEEAILPDGTLNFEKINPVLYMGSDKYLGTAGCKTRILKRDECAKKLQS
ncbi:MAG: flavin reductase family protein [Dehalococcoidales bacterium]|nr:flavin reductase family protein [Dehalococcoidales bacterium]